LGLTCGLIALFAVSLAAGQSAKVADEKGGEAVSGPYDVDPHWPQPLSSELTWGRTSYVYAESPDRVFVIQSGMVPWSWKKLRGADLRGSDESGGTGLNAGNGAMHCASTLGFDQQWPCLTDQDGKRIDSIVERDGTPIPGARWDHIIMVFDRNGKLIENWDQWKYLFSHPHTLTESPYDPEHHVWVVDAGSDQVFEFTNDGKKLVMTIGESRVQGNDNTHLNGPNGIAFLPNGDFYVTDGYKNSRVIKFSKDGKFEFAFGKPGKGPGEFNLPHGIAIDEKGRLYVIDRVNTRIQVFDANGNYIEEWPGLPFGLDIHITKDGRYLWVADGYNNRILKYDLNGHLLYSWGTFGASPGEFWGPHSFSVDRDGNLYTGEVFGGRAQKFKPKEGEPPELLVGPLR
jgi:6-phosphogluconolactonase (cycloisomerase 2 family)